MRLAALFALALLLVPGAGAAERASIWDIELGTSAAAMPTGFVDHACGTNGGPPALPVTGFTEFATCPAEPSGLHEVYFRYDDEAEFTARARQDLVTLASVRGTRVYGIDAILSALFDDQGVLRALRIVSDPRGVEPHLRNDHWRLAGLLRQHFGEDGWTCTDEALAEREIPIGGFQLKRSCSKRMPDRELSLRQEYFHRRGEQFRDEFGKVQPTLFVSVSRFEIASPTP